MPTANAESYDCPRVASERPRQDETHLRLPSDRPRPSTFAVGVVRHCWEKDPRSAMLVYERPGLLISTARCSAVVEGSHNTNLTIQHTVQHTVQHIMQHTVQHTQAAYPGSILRQHTIKPPVRVSVSVSLHMSVSVSVHRSVHTPVYLAMRMSAQLFMRMSIHMSINVSVRRY